MRREVFEVHGRSSEMAVRNASSSVRAAAVRRGRAARRKTGIIVFLILSLTTKIILLETVSFSLIKTTRFSSSINFKTIIVLKITSKIINNIKTKSSIDSIIYCINKILYT